MLALSVLNIGLALVTRDWGESLAWVTVLFLVIINSITEQEKEDLKEEL